MAAPSISLRNATDAAMHFLLLRERTAAGEQHLIAVVSFRSGAAAKGAAEDSRIRTRESSTIQS